MNVFEPDKEIAECRLRLPIVAARIAEHPMRPVSDRDEQANRARNVSNQSHRSHYLEIG